MKRWLVDFLDAYKQRPIAGVLLLAAVILGFTFLGAAIAIRHSDPYSDRGQVPSTGVSQSAQGQTPTPLLIRPGSAPPTLSPVQLRSMPPGAGYDDSSTSWYARHRSVNSPSAPRTGATRLPSPLPASLTASAPTPTPVGLPTPSATTASPTASESATTTPTTSASPTPTTETS